MTKPNRGHPRWPEPAHPGKRAIIRRVNDKVAGLDCAPDGTDLPLDWGSLSPGLASSSVLGIEPSEQLAGARTARAAEDLRRDALVDLQRCTAPRT